MGGEQYYKAAKVRGWRTGKVETSLNAQLDNVEWGEFQLGDLFEIQSNPQLNKDSFNFSNNGKYPYFTRTVTNNGILGYVDYLDEKHKVKGGCLAVGMIAMQFFYMEDDFYAVSLPRELSQLIFY